MIEMKFKTDSKKSLGSKKTKKQEKYHLKPSYWCLKKTV